MNYPSCCDIIVDKITTCSMIMDILTYLDKHCDPENRTERKQENIIQEAADLPQVILLLLLFY